MTSVAEDDTWYQAFLRGVRKHRPMLQVKAQVFSGATDSRFLRRVGIPAFGFSPMNNTPILLHDHNEFINEVVFLRGIEIFCGIIEELASVPL